ncbi:XTP/dITP diphosphohydrolase [Friedmanniella endophytica]|uniref:XTP/dITP diphosphohydrolase n=2 Tax=Microlunatus kandeliicorticis TaxID=1759536 RepID=A0A7W3P646_9ACTN|nr:XTP/dITP diphosphohydrolase [Microlunatus kandeliicorticis]
MTGGELLRLAEVMHRLRADCPWDAEQTHRSLVPYLVEETFEVVEALETVAGDTEAGDVQLREELGDLLFQVYFHAEIAAERGAFDLDDVAAGIADKLVRRHPHVFAGEDVPDDLLDLWERRKAVEKQRSSALDGIPDMSALSRAAKVVGRARSHRVDVELDATPISADELGPALLALVARAQASGIDAEQATRDALRALEARVVAAERG